MKTVNTDKTVLIGRHSLKGNGEEKELISDAGAARMHKQGKRFRGRVIHRAFRTSLVRTTQSIMYFLGGIAQLDIPTFDIVTGLGNADEFKPICPTEVMTLYAGGMSFWQAMESHFGIEHLKAIAVPAGATLKSIFDRMNPGETSLVLAHDPFVSLAVWHLTHELPAVCKDLKEGTIFEVVQDQYGDFQLQEIYVPE